MRRIFIAVKTELLEQIARRMRVVAGAEACLDVSQRRRMPVEIRLLRQIADGRAGLHKAGAAIGLDQTGRDLEQRGLAGAVAPDQAEPIRWRDRELDAAKQRRAAKGQRDVFEL